MHIHNRVNMREEAAVSDWLENTKQPFHIMRDHPTGHDWKILGGMWGARMDLGHREMLTDMFQNLLNDV